MEIAVIAAGGYGAVGYGEDGLIAFLRAGRTAFFGFGHAYAPFFSLTVLAFRHEVAADFHHVVAHLVAVEHGCDGIGTVPFRHGGEVEHRARVVFNQTAVLDADFLVTHELAQAVDGFVGRPFFVFEAEAPRVDQRRNGDVERAVGGLGNGDGARDEPGGAAVEREVLVAVDFRQAALGIEHRQRRVHTIQRGEDVALQVLA